MPDLNRQEIARTVVAFFGQEADAENAIRDMQNVGIPSKRIGIGFDGPVNSGTTPSTHESFWQKIGNFFQGEQDHRQTSGSDYAGFSHVPSAMVSRFDEKLRSGGLLVSVNALTPEEAQEIEDIFEEHDGEVETTAFNETEAATQPERRIQLLSEILRVQKERVPTGEVRLRKETVAENQNIEVPVTREELVIERIPGQGQVVNAPMGTNQEVRVPLSEERVTVEKKPVVAEEVRVGKRAISDTKQVFDQVRREELKIDKEGDVSVSGEEPRTPKRKGVA